MNKIDKLDKELEKAREKAAEWQAKIRELEKQKQEEENSQIATPMIVIALSIFGFISSRILSSSGTFPQYLSS